MRKNSDKPCPCGSPVYRTPKGYIDNLCGKCRIARTIAYRKKNPRKYKNGQLMDKFGITIEQYETMLAAQNGLCAICKRPNGDGRVLNVDHCHKTGNNRGLLCGNCNRGIGNLQETPAILFAAIQYLNQHQ